MTLTEITDTFKAKFNSSKVINPLEKAADFYSESDDNFERKDLGENRKTDPYSNLISVPTKISSEVRISQNGDEPLIKLTNVWKTYQMGEVDFAALKGINLEIYEGGVSGGSWSQWKWEKHTYEPSGLSGLTLKRQSFP
jgi:putative ABC transport system ATP-binding protein